VFELVCKLNGRLGKVYFLEHHDVFSQLLLVLPLSHFAVEGPLADVVASSRLAAQKVDLRVVLRLQVCDIELNVSDVDKFPHSNSSWLVLLDA
jgi:hypothetical protein